MKHPDDRLPTPIYIKVDQDMPWPQEEPVFYLMGRNELFICRNHEFFTSCCPAPKFPSALAPQQSFCRLKYPKLPQAMLETIVGFFWQIGMRHNAEAIALIAWDRQQKQYQMIVPPQVATVAQSRWTGETWPMTVRYQMTPLPPDLVVVGDIHSHANEPAWSSGQDKDDEEHKSGLHFVVGRIRSEPPEFHVEAVVDGTRFRVNPETVIEGYRRRNNHIPPEWIQRVKVECHPVRPSYTSDTEVKYEKD